MCFKSAPDSLIALTCNKHKDLFLILRDLFHPYINETTLRKPGHVILHHFRSCMV